MDEQELTVSDLILLAQPCSVVMFMGPTYIPDVTFILSKEGVNLAQRVSMEELHRSQCMRQLIEYMKGRLDREIDERKRKSMPYEAVCPRGYLDCVRDPAYIKYNQPHLYSQLYGDVTPAQAVRERDGCLEQVYRDPEETHYCYEPEIT